MADSDFQFVPETTQDPNANPTWSDYGRGAVSSVTSGVVAPAAALTAQASQDATSPLGKLVRGLSQVIQQHANAETEDLDSDQSDAWQKRATAAITDPDFYNHPFSAALVKMTGMAGPVVAAGLMGGPIGAAVVGGALGAGGYENEIDQTLDSASDKDLMANPVYANYRGMGLSPDDAKAKLKQKLGNSGEFINALAGAVAGAIGPAAKAGAGLAGKEALTLAGEGAGALTRAGAGAAEGAAGGALQSGAADATGQQAQVDLGLKKDTDYDALAKHVAEGGMLGGVMGAAAGAAVPEAKGAIPDTADRAPAAEAPAKVESNVPNPDQTNIPQQGRADSDNPVSPAAPGGLGGSPQATAPATAKGTQAVEAVKAKAKAAREAKTSVQTVSVDGPSPDQAAAIAAKPEPVTPSAEEIAANAQKAAEAVKVQRDAAQVAQQVLQPPQPQPQPEPAQQPAPTPEPQQAPQISQQAPQPEPRPEPVQQAQAPQPEPARPEPAQQPAPAPQQAAPVTPEVTQPTPNAPAPSAPPQGGRVLQSQTPEAQANQKAQNAQLDKNLATKEAPSGQRKAGKAEQDAKAERAQIAKEVFEKHAPEDRGDDVPTSRDDRDAMSAQLGAMLDDARARGVMPREELDETVRNKVFPPKKKNGEDLVKREKPTPEEFRQGHLSIPEKVASTDGHVMYLREAVSIKKLLDKKSALTKSDKERIQKFMIEERAAKGGDTEMMRARRKEDGDLMKRQDQGDVEKEAAPASADVGNNTREDAMSPEERMIAREDDEAAPSEEPVEQGKNVQHINVAQAERKALTPAEARAARKAALIGIGKKKEVTPEVTPAKPPEATSAKVVDKAAERTNTNPTEGQKEAGNYAKGTVKWHGMDVAIENPKDSIRTGRGADGKEWSVKMPDHYGYIKRTEGADGDQVDVFMGPNPKSEHVFVVHQKDLKTGEFDEHKAMLGYDTLAEALRAYKGAFSDGQGEARVKDVEYMTADQFKDWVKSDNPKKGDAFEAAMRNESDKAKSRPIDSMQKLPARDVLKSLSLEHLSGVPKAIAELARKHFQTMVGDTDVHVVSPEQMAAATGHADDAFAGPNAGTRGLARLDRQTGKTSVLLRADQFHSPGATAHVTLHEIAHAYTMRALAEDPVLYKRVGRMMEETKEFLKDLPDLRQKIGYALSDEREFVAEAFSNPDVQEVLSGVPMSDELAQSLGLHMKKPTMWDAVVDTVRGVIEKLTGRIPQSHRMIEGVLKMGSDFDRQVNAVKAKRLLGHDTSVKVHDAFEPVAKLTSEVKDKFEKILKRPELQEQDGNGFVAKAGRYLMTNDQLAQKARSVGLGAVRKVADVVEQTRMKAQSYLKKSEPIITKLYQLERKYKDSGMWQKFTSLVHDETMAGVYADRDLASQSHLGKDALKGMWGKAQHADLSARYKELPEDLQAARAEAMKFFTDQQNAMSLGIIKNRVLKTIGINDDALAQRIHEGRTTDADTAAFGEGGEHTLGLIKQAKELAKIEGPYFPLMRRGEYVLSAKHKVEAPENATKLSDNEFEFAGKDARKKAIEFAQQQDNRPAIKSVWVDKNTGETHYDDEHETKVHPADQDAEQRFRVAVQNRHVEFGGEKEMLARAAELKKAGLDVSEVQRRRMDGGQGVDLQSHQMQQLADTLKRRESYKNLSASQKNDVVQALNEASLRMLGSTRIQTKRLPRTYVEGASHDLTRNTWDYAQSTSGYLAKLDHQPELDDAIKAMDEGVAGSDGKSLVRSEIAREMHERLAKQGTYQRPGAFSQITQRIMSLSFMDKLFSPAFNVVNSLQPAMVTMPTLAAKYGVGRSFNEMGRAYRDIAGLNVVGKGVKDTIAKAKGSTAETNFLDEMKARLKPKEREMLDYLAERGSIDRESGMEIGKLIKARNGVIGKIDTGISYMEGIARQMPQAIEMMNRAVTALSTYRLEMARGASHDDAMVAAQEAVNNTQGLYSASNAAPIFNHPLGKISLQFKKYGQMMYHLLGSNVGKALHGATPEERAQAIKTLVGLAATHTAIAGALGLPTEPFKALLMGANAAGLTNTAWGDVENKVREMATSALGKTGGEVFSRGLPRLLGVDLSSRVGLDSLMTFGEPKSYKDSDVKSWLFDTVAGAPVSLVGDWIKGGNALMNGDVEKAAELMIPNKFAADSLRAYREMSEGKKSAAGRETMTPYSPLEAATRAFGFTPRREAETSEMNSAYYSASKAQKSEREDLINGWVKASPADKMKAWSDIQKFNAASPREARVTLAQLSSANKRQRTSAKTAARNGGMTASRYDQTLLKRANDTYNP